MCQEKNEEEDSLAFKIASKITLKNARKTDYSDQKQYRKHKHQQNKNYQKIKIGRKTTVWISEISHGKTWTWPRKRSLKRETEFILIAAQNNTKRTISPPPAKKRQDTTK